LQVRLNIETFLFSANATPPTHSINAWAPLRSRITRKLWWIRRSSI